MLGHLICLEAIIPDGCEISANNSAPTLSAISLNFERNPISLEYAEPPHIINFGFSFCAISFILS